jgi:choline dehydrogenase-like flavoprotein
VLRAFAQALLPAGDGLPGAEVEGGVAVVDPAERLLVAAPARARGAARIGLRVLGWTPFPRRFTRLSPERRIAHVQRLEDGRSRLRRDLVLLGKTLTAVAYARDPAVQAALGCQAGCEPLEPGAAPALALDRDALVAPADVERCDVVIVGSGAGGASAARVLAEAGLDVIVVEHGAYHDAASYPRDPIEALPTLYRDAGLTICEGRPAIPVPVGRCVGGTTVINSGTCLRAPGDVLLGWRERFGIAWATELEGEFEAVERALGVTPVDLATAGRNAQLCHAGAEALGASNRPILRNAPVLRRCGTCATGCAIDAKQAMHVSELPRAVAAGARVRASAEVREVLLEHGRAAGVRCRLADGGRYEVRARAVVLAGGALGTPELLLRQGIGNGSGAVGRHLRIHPACWVGARFDEQVRGWDGVMQSWHVDEWHERGLFLEATFAPPAFGAHWLHGAGDEYRARVAAYDQLAVIGVHLSERSEGRVCVRGGALRMSYRLREDDAAALRFGIARAADLHFAAGAQEVYPQIGGVPALRPGDQGPRVEHARIHPADLRLEAFHPMGTVRMGADPRTCVVGPSGESHDVPGLYVADASVFPTSLRVNPMLTVMACARHVAGTVADRVG